MADDLRYPIGKFAYDGPMTPERARECLTAIADTPAMLRAAVAGLTDQQLDTPYRPGGWTVRQVVHHVPDSHMNSYMRFRWALTEEQPAVKGYDEAAWAKLPDAHSAPVEISLSLLETLHRRWMMLLESLSPEQWKRTFLHSELGPVSLERNLALYAWHGTHHVAHVRQGLGIRD